MGMLKDQPRSGFDLAKEMDNVIHFFWTTDQSQVYRTLYSLRDKGWVEFEEIQQSDNPNKKVHSLTPIGRRELLAWLAKPAQDGPNRNAFLAQVHFADAVGPAAQVEVLEARLNAIRQALSILEQRAAKGGLPIPLTPEALRRKHGRKVLALEYGIRRFRFELRWLKDAIQLLRSAP